MTIPPNPYETYGLYEETKGPCDECQRIAPLDEMALIASKYVCDRCLDPKQKAFDLVISIIEQQEATIQGLRGDLRNTQYMLRIAKGGKSRRLQE
jgi:hypothetical protein